MSVIRNTLDKNFVALEQTWNKIVSEKVLKRVEDKKKEIIDRINNRD